MPHEEKQPVVIIEKSSGVGSFLLGALLGAGAALLLAPRTGEETREVLRARGRRLRSKAEDTAGELQNRLEDGYERAKARVEDKFDRARQNLGDTRDGARDAVEAGKAAVQSARHELERRLSDARASRKKGEAAAEEREPADSAESEEAATV